MERSPSPPSGLEILALVLAALGSLCLILQFLLGWAGSEIVWGSLLGWACAVLVGSLSARPERGRLRLGIGLVVNFLLPLIALWQAPALGAGWLLAGGISLSYIVTLVTWVLGIENERSAPATRSFHLTLGGGGKNSPLAGSLVTGLLAFAMPLPNPLAPLLAGGYLVSLLALTSLGALEKRRREEAAVLVGFPTFLAGWGSRIVSLLALALLAGAGGVGGVRLAQAGMFSTHFGSGHGLSLPFGLPSPGDSAGGKAGVPDAQKAEGAPTVEPGEGAGKGLKTAQVSDPGRALPDLMPLLRKILPILAVGLALAYTLTRYGVVLLRWLQQACAKLLAPLGRSLRALRTGLISKRREAALRAIMESLPDPYAPVTPEDTPDILFQKWVEAAAFFGVDLKTKDGVHDFAYRLERLNLFSTGDLHRAAQVCSEGVYGPATLDQERLSQTRQFIERFQQTALERVSMEQRVQARKQRLRDLAIARLSAREVLPVNSAPE